MAALTRCAMTRKTKCQAISLGRLAQCLAWAAAGVALALLHVYVQFTIADLRRSAHLIQVKRMELENRSRELSIEFERLKSQEHIDQLARQWGMDFDASGRIEKVSLPVELAARYEDRAWDAVRRRSGEAPGEESGNLLVRMMAGVAGLGGAGSAYAEVGTRTGK